MTDTDAFLRELKLGKHDATRLAESRSTSLGLLRQHAEAAILIAQPWTKEDLFAGFKALGYSPGGLFIPTDPQLELQVRAKLRELGQVSDRLVREAAYRAYQRELELLEASGVAGEWQWQQRLARSTARFRIARWGRRGGKSGHASGEGSARAVRRPRSTVWCAAKTDDAVSRTFTMIADRLESRGYRQTARRWANAEDSRHIELDNGSIIMGITLGGDLSAAGTGVDLLILDEAEYATDDDWKMKCLPTLADKLGQALIISSAQTGDDTWFNARVEQAIADHDPKWAVFDMPSWDNFYAFPQGRDSEAIRDAEKEHEDDPAGFLAIYGGKPSGERDRIFYAYKPSVHLADDVEFNPWKPVVCVADPSGGINEYDVHAFQDYGDHVEVIDEFYRTGVTTEEIAAELDTRPWRYLVEAIYVDQGSNAMEIIRWARVGWPAAPITVEDKLGHTVPGKPDLDVSVPIVNNVFRNPTRFRAYQRHKLAVVLLEWGFLSFGEVPENRRRALAIELEERLADGNLTPLDIAALRDCSGIRISRQNCPNLAKELLAYRKRRRRDANQQDQKLLTRKTADHACDVLRYWCWIFRRHEWTAGVPETYIEVDEPAGQGYQGTNWLESVRMQLMGRRSAGESYLVPG